MAKDAIRRILKIQMFQPETFPMARLAEYMAELATILGEKEHVHFVKLEDGCTQLVHDIAFIAYPKIQERIVAVKTGTAPAEAMGAYRALNRKMAADNTFGAYVSEDETIPNVALDFPGRNTPKPLEILPIEQPGNLVGVVQGVGGKTITDTRIPVYVDTGDTVHTCNASRAVARELGPFVLGDQRRFHGTATWQRDEVEAWVLKKFTINTHEPIEQRTLSEVVEDLRKVPSGLTEIRDPWGELIRSRRDEGGTH